MKSKILTTLFICVSFLTYGQTKEKEQSNAEKFSSKSGTLIKKEFIEVGKVKDCKIDVVIYTDLISNTSQKAVRFEYESIGKYTTSTKSAVLDVDEIDALITSIKLIQTKVFNTVPENYTEVSFKSRGGFEAGCFWSKGAWSTYLKLEKFDSDSYVWLKQENFSELLTLLEAAKLKLK